MTPERKSELIAVAISAPEPAPYYTDDAAAIRDVRPKLNSWRIQTGLGGVIQCWHWVGEKRRCDTGPTDAAAICEAFAAANGGWDELERRYAT